MKEKQVGTPMSEAVIMKHPKEENSQNKPENYREALINQAFSLIMDMSDTQLRQVLDETKRST